MRLSLLMLLMVGVIVSSVTGRGVSGEDFGESVTGLNSRIESAMADGREWPKYPGGLASFLFGQDSVVGNGRIYFVAENESDGRGGRWREVAIARSSDGAWRVSSIRACGESDAREFVELRENLRKASAERMGFDYVTQGPVELLSLLTKWKSNYWLSPILPFGWVQESDLPALVELLDSSVPCANVQSMLSSYIDTTRSTVGNEAAYLIEGYRRDSYPPRLNSTRPFCDIEEIKKWWEERQGT